MLAEALSTSPESYGAVGWLIVGIAALGAGIAGVQRFIRSSAGLSEQERTIGGQPLRVQSQPPFVTRDDLDRTTTPISDRVTRVEAMIANTALEVSRMRMDMHALENRMNASGEDRAAKIHGRINDVLEAVAELRGHMDALDGKAKQ
jgi:uncharacterized coiled-coil protein SlyX